MFGNLTCLPVPPLLSSSPLMMMTIMMVEVDVGSHNFCTQFAPSALDRERLCHGRGLPGWHGIIV